MRVNAAATRCATVAAGDDMPCRADLPGGLSDKLLADSGLNNRSDLVYNKGRS